MGVWVGCRSRGRGRARARVRVGRGRGRVRAHLVILLSEGGGAVDHAAARILRNEVSRDHAVGTLVRGRGRGRVGGRVRGRVRDGVMVRGHLGALLGLEVAEGRRVLLALERLTREGLAQHLDRGVGWG